MSGRVGTWPGSFLYLDKHCRQPKQGPYWPTYLKETPKEGDRRDLICLYSRLLWTTTLYEVREVDTNKVQPLAIEESIHGG